MKILLFDGESLPNVCLTWGTWEQNVIKVWKRRMLCSISWQWYPSKKREVLALCDLPGYDPRRYMRSIFTGKPDFSDSVKLMATFGKIRRQADVAIGHNIDEFDDKMVNTDVFLNKLPAMPRTLTVDTLKVLRLRMRLNSNKLTDVCQELGIGEKVKHPGIEMWEGCMRGEDKWWRLMKKYNAHDVDPLLRGLYEHVRPWVTNHPNLQLRDGKLGCPSCRSTNLTTDGFRYTQAMKYQRYVCKDCRSTARGIMQGRKGQKTLVLRPI